MNIEQIISVKGQHFLVMWPMADVHISVNGRTTSAQKASLHFSTDPERNVLVPTGVPVVVGTRGRAWGYFYAHKWSEEKKKEWTIRLLLLLLLFLTLPTIFHPTPFDIWHYSDLLLSQIPKYALQTAMKCFKPRALGAPPARSPTPFYVPLPTLIVKSLAPPPSPPPLPHLNKKFRRVCLMCISLSFMITKFRTKRKKKDRTRVIAAIMFDEGFFPFCWYSVVL